MHRSTLAALILAGPLLTSACNHETHTLGQHPPGDEAATATITAANAGLASAETANIIDTVGVVAVEPPLGATSAASASVTVPCATLGYGGSGTVTATGTLQNPGDKMEISFNGCTLAGAPIAGTVEATLESRFQNDDGEGYATNYRYQNFTIGAASSLSTISGAILIEGRYDYQTETMTTTRSSNSLQLTRGDMSIDVSKLECIDSYTGLWDDAPFTMECDLTYHSSAMGGTVVATTIEPFRGVGGESRPTSGKQLITGANNSKTMFIAQEDGQHVLVKWDEDGDDSYEGQVQRTWEELKQDILDWGTGKQG
ncbi:MAG TPA: hypothetical protein ENJ43_05570 [Gammaproteobacteria bacterium]|nr:hypothetical protein [Gammaproteobacteria bacterium]